MLDQISHISCLILLLSLRSFKGIRFFANNGNLRLCESLEKNCNLSEMTLTSCQTHTKHISCRCQITHQLRFYTSSLDKKNPYLECEKFHLEVFYHYKWEILHYEEVVSAIFIGYSGNILFRCRENTTKLKLRYFYCHSKELSIMIDVLCLVLRTHLSSGVSVACIRRHKRHFIPDAENAFAFVWILNIYIPVMDSSESIM